MHILIQSGNGTVEDLQDMGAGNNAQPEAQPQPRRSRMVGKMKEARRTFAERSEH